MKNLLRILGLALALVVVFYAPASAYPLTCYYACQDGFRTITVSYEECCGGSLTFPCAGGEPGLPYGFDDGSGPQFC